MPAVDPVPGERIAHGVDRLEPACPRWYLAVDPEVLDFTDPERGVLAAIYGHHGEGLRILGIPAGEAADYGFEAHDAHDTRLLERAWRAWIRTSREAGGPAR